MNEFSANNQGAEKAGEHQEADELGALERHLHQKSLAEIQNALGPAGRAGQDKVLVEIYSPNGEFEAAIIAIAAATEAIKNERIPGPEFITKFSKLPFELQETIGESLVAELDNDQILENQSLAELAGSLRNLEALQRALPRSKKIKSGEVVVDYKFLNENFVAAYDVFCDKYGSDPKKLNDELYLRIPRKFGLRAAVQKLAEKHLARGTYKAAA